MTKYIFVTGGVVSGLGKGITAASLGRLLKARDLNQYSNLTTGKVYWNVMYLELRTRIPGNLMSSAVIK